MSHQFISSIVPPADHRSLYNKMRERLEVGDAEQNRLITQVAQMVIRDKLAPPDALRVHPDDEGNRMIIRYKGEDPCTIHPHALGQLAAKVNVPMTYVNHLNANSPGHWKRELLGTVLTESFHKTHFPERGGNPRFLHRIVGNELRGFLSRRFNRHLASMPLLQAFLGVTKELDAFPLDVITTDVKVGLRCFLPYVFEPVEKQYVCIGSQWSNSDFGSGRLSVSLIMWAPQFGRFTLLDHSLARVHIGSIIEDAEIDMSEGTAQKEVAAQASAIGDTVRDQLSIPGVEKVLKAIEIAHTEAIPWTRLKGNLKRYLGVGELDKLHQLLTQEVEDLPPVQHASGEILGTKWWASNALSWLAERETNTDRKLELQSAAGSFVEVKS